MKPVLVDTGFIVARLDRTDPYHQRCLRVPEDVGTLVTCEAVLAESCHLLRHLHGAAERIMQNVREGIFQIQFALASRTSEVETLLKKYADVPMELADACLVDLATQKRTGRILTLDSDFRFYRWAKNRPFQLLIDF
ncbi:MAG: PIN domain-containing protein [Planctomycetes bacterium]|nr:PIN domain-containing protein [Planctomycetota bacterium]